MTPEKDEFSMATEPTPSQHKESKVASVCFNIVSTILFGVSPAVIRKSEIGGNTATLATGIMGILIGLCSYLTSKEQLISLQTALKVGANGLCFGGLLNFFYFLSLNYVTMGDANAVNIFSSFIISKMVEVCLLKHRPHCCSYLSGIFGCAGVILITQSSFSVNSNHLLGVLFSIISGTFAAIFYINMQYFTDVPLSVLLMGFFLGSSILPLPEFFRENFSLPSASIEDRVLALFGYWLFVMAVICAIMGSQLSIPSASFVIKMFSIVLCFLLQVFWLHETTHVTSLVGALCIGISIFVESVTVVACSTPIRKLPQKDSEAV